MKGTCKVKVNSQGVFLTHGERRWVCKLESKADAVQSVARFWAAHLQAQQWDGAGASSVWDMTIRVQTVMKRLGLETPEQVRAYGWKALMRQKHFGLRSLYEVAAWLDLNHAPWSDFPVVRLDD